MDFSRISLMLERDKSSPAETTRYKDRLIRLCQAITGCFFWAKPKKEKEKRGEKLTEHIPPNVLVIPVEFAQYAECRVERSVSGLAFTGPDGKWGCRIRSPGRRH